ncbi:MAG TPA: CDP-diacylglycerol--serine O-phosphatidyltransferase [Candidatus Nanoarchaeia archaeon]|nr:CDP-diacylglycerol--serine O-phosphatidyltransferase [Candidatus Nanoarchaeia archaeon]
MIPLDIFERMKAADYITLGNGIAGFAAIILSLRMQFSWAALALLLAVAFDYADGMLARWLQQGNAFGEQLDTLSDIISFGVAPAVFAYMMGFTQPGHLAIYAVFLAAGMLRLARFNVTHQYLGMPITMNGIIVPLLFFFWEESIVYYLVISVVLMLSTIRFRRQR